jgi:hypothetical protein
MQAPPQVDTTLVKALARAFRWRKLLETGTYGTIQDLAAAEKINRSYVRGLLRMTLLAPDIVEAILDGRQPHEMTLFVLMRPLPHGMGVSNDACYVADHQLEPGRLLHRHVERFGAFENLPAYTPTTRIASRLLRP